MPETSGTIATTKAEHKIGEESNPTSQITGVDGNNNDLLAGNNSNLDIGTEKQYMDANNDKHISVKRKSHKDICTTIDDMNTIQEMNTAQITHHSRNG